MCPQQWTEPGCGFMDVSTDRAWLWIPGCVSSNGQSLVVDSWMCPQQWTELGCGFVDVSPAMDRAWLWIRGCIRSTSRLCVCVCRWMCSAFWCRASCLLRRLFCHAAVSASWTLSGPRFTILLLLLYRQGSDTRVDIPKHTHTPFNGPFSRTTRVSRYQKGKTNLDFTEARDSEWQWHQLGHIKSAPRYRQITMPAPHHSQFFTGRIPFLLPNQQRQSTRQ